MAENRYAGKYPVIGIRPIIDARRGPMKLRRQKNCLKKIYTIQTENL